MIFMSMPNNYHSSSHSKYLLQCHLVFSTKYRKRILNGTLSDDLKQIMYDIANEKDIIIKAMETDEDHIHLMVDYSPKKSVLEMVNNFKSISTFRIYKKHRAFLKGHLGFQRSIVKITIGTHFFSKMDIFIGNEVNQMPISLHLSYL
jgi:putative transposase